ncbi:MAG TPA: histidine kinase, partial [Chitinophagaceae bacterium]|nr:histidine kinase [Chitinophagaceae bacterium]
SIHEDQRGWLWFATGYQGISLLRDGRLENFNRKTGLPDNTHYRIYQTRKNEIWTAGDMGLTKIIYDAKSDSVSFLPYHYPVPIAYHKVYNLTEGPDGTLWAGGQLGLFRLRKDRLEAYALPQMKERIFVTDIKAGPGNKVWLATRGHGIILCTYDKNGDLQMLDRLTKETGLSSNTFLSLVTDVRGRIWAGNYSGITAITTNGTKYSIRNFDVRDGFINKNFQTLRMYRGQQLVWACTSSGVVSFHPDSLLAESRNAILRVTGVTLPGYDEEGNQYFNGSAYNFPHSVHAISINVAAPYFSNPSSVHYYYRLAGMDSSWTEAGQDGVINFRGLEPGQYTVLLRASVGGNQWTNTIPLTINIASPWWKRWWFILISTILLAGGIFSLVRYRERTLRKKEQLKTEMERLRSDSYRHQLEIEQIINYFTVSLAGHNTVDGVLWDVARNCISRLEFEDCVIYLLDEDNQILIQKAAWGPKTTEENAIINPIEIPVGRGIVGTVAKTGNAELIADTSKDPRYIVDDQMRFSEITVPIFEEGKVIGVIDSEHSQKNFYTERHMQILATIASHCGARIGTIKAEAREQAARMEALLNKQKALVASLQSMRLQMNPHFLFNALNSIQQMILSGEEMTATRFLSKFSKLLRLVLTSSDREELSLKEELEILNLYVELESLRFKESFTYSIECDPAVDVEETYVPSLLFQPFVENAIWHGLMHKDGSKRLSIRFHEKSEGVLFCVIEDNGVGRAFAARTHNNGNHTGKGVKLGLERLAVLNEKNGTNNKID